MKLKNPPCAWCCCFDCHQTKKEKLECKRIYKKHPERLEPLLVSSPIIMFKIEEMENKYDKR